MEVVSAEGASEAEVKASVSVEGAVAVESTEGSAEVTCGAGIGVDWLVGPEDGQEARPEPHRTIVR